MGRNMFLELAYSKCSVSRKRRGEKNIEKIHRTKHDTKHTDSDFFHFFFLREQSCTYLVKILSLVPRAEFCASPMNNSRLVLAGWLVYFLSR